MGKPSNSPSRDPIDIREVLQRESYRFEFFQAVRLLRWLGAKASADKQVQRRQPIGDDYGPQEEVVRLRATPSHQFPQGSISSYVEKGTSDWPPEMSVAFFGLVGPQGVLPRHYTQLVIDRLRAKDPALRDFLDTFNHRLLSLFYRAWTKYRLPIAYEESVLDGVPTGEDRISQCLYSLVGVGTLGLRGRHQFSDPVLIYYAGQFAQRPKNVSSLQALVSDYFQLPSVIQQFQGQWLYLDPADQSRPGKPPLNRLWNNRLGADVVVGCRVWSVENKFRVRLGPLNYTQFLRFTPAGQGLRKLAQFIRMYVGPEYDFDLQLVLRRDEIPACQIRGGRLSTVRLGWNTWVRTGPDRHDVADAVFVAEGQPDNLG